MPTKILMRWNVLSETESEYFEFLVHEFIPGMTKLGIDDIQVWYTAYGDVEQKLAAGQTETKGQMVDILASGEWILLTDKLETLVEDYNLKIIPATQGFQL